MNLFAPIAVVASMLLATSAYAQEDQRVTDAKAAASAWLAQLDAGQYPATWASSAGAFRAVVSQENWLQAMQQVHAPLGPVNSRTLKSAQFTRAMPNVPAGEYVVIQYDTTFANRAGSVETVTPMRDKDGSWKVSGYFVR